MEVKVHCPYCKSNFNVDTEDFEEFYDGDYIEIKCEDCGELFDVIADISIKFLNRD